MSRRTDLLERLRELKAVVNVHRLAKQAARETIIDGDLDAGESAIDSLELALHPALAAGGGPGGSGLPEQWTDGGNGDVTATVDDVTKTPITLEGTADHEAALFLIDEPDDGSNYSDVVVIVGEKGGPDETNLFAIDSAGQVSITTKDVGAAAVSIFPASGSAAFGAHILSVATDGVAAGTLLDVEASGKFAVGNAELADGLLLHGPHAAPDNGAMNNGDLMLWVDQTNGAAKLMIKAKTANGTVVTGQVALS